MLESSMYLPKANEETRLEVLHSLIGAHPLATWVSLCDGELVANHVPFELDATRGEFGTLVGHVARANPIWKQASAITHLVTFQGPHSYITPSWYPSKHEHGKAVPTWNYAVVHAYGMPNYIEDASWLRAHVSALTNRHETTQALPWKVSDAPADYLEKMITAIVGVEIPIRKLIGKWKMSQNRPVPDQLGVVAGLMGRNDAHAKGVASIIQDNLAAGSH
jgi:transcriptional regulator